MASIFLAVSIKVSPFERLLPPEEKSITSAPSLRAAREKLVRVRVEFEIKINKLYHANVSLTKRVKGFEEAQKEEAISSANSQSRIEKLQRELAGLKSVLQHRDVQLEGLNGSLDSMVSA